MIFSTVEMLDMYAWCLFTEGNAKYRVIYENIEEISIHTQTLTLHNIYRSDITP